MQRSEIVRTMEGEGYSLHTVHYEVNYKNVVKIMDSASSKIRGE